jgi:uncharacterized protein (DUF779 family)
VSDTPPQTRISVTPAAGHAITRLLADRGAPVMFVQSGSCCAGSTPMCFPAGEFLVGDNDYIDAGLDRAWHQDRFILDVATGPAEGFRCRQATTCISSSLSPACETPHRVDHELRRLT